MATRIGDGKGYSSGNSENERIRKWLESLYGWNGKKKN
ncbi:hypothetical protein D082_27620 [Synechocystis sp. PCC 6714]|nr:hypothetical protein D082_27620 [Synechocystis sp. PCC 6714]